MKIGMNLLLWTTQIDEKLYPIFEKLKETGYDGVEIPVGDPGVQKYRDVAKHVASLGLSCSAVSSIFEDENPVSKDPSIRARAVEQMKWRLDMSAELGANVLCGPFHSAFAVFSGEPPQDEERKRSAEVLRQVAEYAETLDIVITPEGLNRFECYLYNTLDGISSLLDAVDHTHCKMILDTHHAHIEEKNTYASILKHSRHIAHVHISENDRGTPGAGQVHWEDVFKGLHEINYDGWLTIEAFSRNNPEFASGINVWRNYQPTLDEIYRDGYHFIRTMWDKYG